MSSPSEREAEIRDDARARFVWAVCRGGLEQAVEQSGGVLTGFSAKMSGSDVLLTLRADFPDGKMIAFVGGETLASALTKAYREAKADATRWRPDLWD